MAAALLDPMGAGFRALLPDKPAALDSTCWRPQAQTKRASASPFAPLAPPPHAQVKFRSEWLGLAGAASSAMNELLSAKEALSTVRVAPLNPEP